jgi:hypothetical protein
MSKEKAGYIAKLFFAMHVLHYKFKLLEKQFAWQHIRNVIKREAGIAQSVL